MPEEEEIETRVVIPCDDACQPQIDIVQFEELYDMINLKVRTDLQADYDCKKINGATFADTWAKMMSPAIGQVMGAMTAIQNKETAHDRAIKEAQVALYTRQEEGFDDNLRQKLFETQMNSWAMMFSSGLLEEKPQIIDDQQASKLYADILAILDDGTTALGYFTKSITATIVVGGQTTVSWGEVTGATSYTLYASTPEGQLPGYPDGTVTANGSVDITLPVQAVGETVKYTFEIKATDGSDVRNSTATLTYTGV